MKEVLHYFYFYVIILIGDRMSYFEFILKIICEKRVYGPVLSILGGLILYKIVINILHNLLIKGKDGFEKKRRMTIFNLMRSIVTYLVYLVIILVILSIFGVNVSSIVASLGIVSVVLGLALQDTLKDFINGIFIITDNFFVVGDTIQYNEFQGEVIALGFRTTKIKNFKGEVKVIANRNISEVVNLSQQRAVLFIKIPSVYEAKRKNVEKEIEKIRMAINDFKNVYKAQYLGISSFSDSFIEYTIKVECKASTQWQIERDIYGLIKDEYDVGKIDIPYQKIEIVKK